MRVLAFDTSTVATGYALVEDGKTIQTGVIRPVDEYAAKMGITKTAAKEYMTERETFIYITDRCSALMDEIRPDYLVVEDAFMKMNASVLRLLARLSGGLLRHWVENNRAIARNVYVVMASSARARVGCKGNSKKPEVIAFVNQRWGLTIEDDNIADAIVLAQYGYAMASMGEKKPRARRKERGWKR